MWWKESISSLKGIGVKKAAQLAAVNIYTVGDLLEYYPRLDAYVDYSRVKTIDQLFPDGSRQIFRASVYRIRDSFKSRQRHTVVTVRDATGFAEIYFFQAQRYQAKKLKLGDELLIMGKVKPSRGAKMITEPFCQPVDQEVELGILPLYPLAGTLTQNNLRGWMRQALAKAEQNLPETLPQSIIQQCRLVDRYTALKNIHFPQNWAALAQAKRRFVFEELFLLQCGLLYYRQQNQEQRQGVAHGASGPRLQQLVANLPFSLTPAQQQAWREISHDMEQERPMHRILQGDVGSGKTVISALALVKAVEQGCQGCLMAPTEILAAQHYETLQEYFTPLGIQVGLLTGGMGAKARRELLENIALGTLDIVVGTHALLQEDVHFARLSLVVTDEQHRFGVAQRAQLANKGSLAPDVLIMTATPIPRTLALTVYGDLDISLMEGKPAGRKEVRTLCYTEAKRQEVYEGLVRQVQAGRQAYVVCPLIEFNEENTSRSAEELYEELSSGLLQQIPCALLHGRMRGREKEAIMSAFAAGTIKVLISTTVIEVGVNVPNATLMIIENAERFGLAQLHQLRGRVGRGEAQSFCVLLTGSDNPDTLTRLQVLHNSNDGFYLAEKDLELRGAGHLFGLRQHGLPDLRIADILRDTKEIARARQLAQQLMQDEAGWQEMQSFVRLQFDDRFSMIFNI